MKTFAKGLLASTLLLGCTAAIPISLSMATEDEGPLVLRDGGAVHFHLEGHEVAPKHQYDGGEALKSKKSDVVWRKGDKKGFAFYRGKTLGRYHRIYALTPEGQRVPGIIYWDVGENYYLADFVLRIRPGWSGTPVFDERTSRCIGLISGVRAFSNMRMGGFPDRFAIIGRIPSSFPKVPHEPDTPDHPGNPQSPKEDQGRGR